MIFFLFCHVVITLFTFRTCQCDFYAHDFHLHCVFAFSVIADVCGGLFLCGRQRSYPLFLCIKKRPSSMSLFDYITISLPRQEFFEGGRPGSGGSGRLWAGFADSLLTPAEFCKSSLAARSRRFPACRLVVWVVIGRRPGRSSTWLIESLCSRMIFHRDGAQCESCIILKEKRIRKTAVL